jgi:hypothetical protein
VTKKADAFSVGKPDHENAPSRKPQTIHSQVPLDTVGSFVKTKSLRLNTDITSILTSDPASTTGARERASFTACESMMIRVVHLTFFKSVGGLDHARHF